MTRLYSFALPAIAEPELVETLLELQRITCISTAFVEIGEAVVVHFAAIADAEAFIDTLAFLLESMAAEDGAVLQRDEREALLSCLLHDGRSIL